MPIKVLLAASECAPLAKVGGLGDVIGALPKALEKLGVDVRIILPKYGLIDEQKYSLKMEQSGILAGRESIDIFSTKLPGTKIPVYLIGNEKFFGAKEVYSDKSAFSETLEEIEKFLFFSQCVPEVFKVISWFPDIVHCHDFHTSPVSFILKQKKLAEIKSLLTIHNLANQGKCLPEEFFSFFGKGAKDWSSFTKRDKIGDFNILQQGILNADILNTVSPSYREEILTKEYGDGLEEDLLQREKDLYGILNGIDTAVFDPQSDPSLLVNYSRENLAKKLENKIDLQGILGFEQSAEKPLLGMINRLTDQKGIDLLIDIIPELVREGAQLAVLGVGHENYEKKLLELAREFPHNISVQIKFDAVLAQKIYGGADIFLMPSRFEPCGLVQMVAMRYGTIPVVRATGGLRDTVIEGETGFIFEKYASPDFFAAIKRSLECYKNKASWQKLQKKAMASDFSWENSAEQYLEIYKKLAA